MRNPVVPIRPDLRQIAAVVGRPVTRFAPSPTGYLHLGHVVNAIYVWGLARVLGGRVLLRLEDHDRIRCRAGLESALLQDLDWLGFEADEGRQPLQRQSDRDERYAHALAQLRSSHHVYACRCSRKAISGERYDGRCRLEQLPDAPGHRVRVELAPGMEQVDDLLCGHLEQSPTEQCGDLLLRDRDGHWTYQFAVTVDDLHEGITLVIRGMDLLSSTGRQVRLARMLGRLEPARFLHHPLLLRPDGKKLSKSHGDIGVRELRLAGLTPADAIGRAAFLAGLVDEPRGIAARDVPLLFDRVGTHGQRQGGRVGTGDDPTP